MKKINQFIPFIILALPLVLSQCKKLSEEQDCVFPDAIVLKNLTNVSVEASWNTAADAEQYLFEYRKVGTTTYTTIRVTSGTSTKIINLASATTYEYRVQSNCPSSNSDYSEVKQFTTISNNEFNIAKKWRMNFYKENNVSIALGANDYLEFKTGGALTQSLTVGGNPATTDGTWQLYSSNDSVQIDLGTVKKWRIQSMDAGNFLLIKNAAAPLTTVDSLRMTAF
jgi:hypothetical protein